MSGLAARTSSILLVSLVCACGDSGAGDDLPDDGGFTTGGETMSTTMTTASTSSTTSATLTTSSTDATGTESVDGTTSSSSDGTTTTTTTSSTTNGTTTTGDTTDGTTGNMQGVCGNAMVEANEVCYMASTELAMGAAPSDVAIGDFDDDGNLDVATSNGGGSNVSVRLGNGDGTFGAEATFTVGAAPSAIVATDFDGDGNDDLATSNRTDGTVSVLIADGSGGFAAADTYTVGTTPSDITVASLTAANEQDIVVGNSGSMDYHTLVSDGNGGFAVNGPFGTGNPGITVNGIATGSFNTNTDQIVDVFTAGGPSFRGSPGNGDGTIDDTAVVGFDLGGDIARCVAALVDNNDDLDLVLPNPPGDLVHVLAGMGNAMFTAFDVDIGAAPSDVAIADLSNDGDMDLAGPADDDNVYVVPGTGNANTWQPPEPFAVGLGPSGIKLADLDGDTVPDIVTSNATSDDISVLLSNP